MRPDSLYVPMLCRQLRQHGLQTTGCQRRAGEPMRQTDDPQSGLGRLLQREGELKSRASQLEDAWLERQEAMEELKMVAHD